MHHTTFSQMRHKDVVNVADGTRMGRICDIELDVDDCDGRLTAIIVPGPTKLFGLIRSDEELVIPYSCIRKIGEDVILVEVRPKIQDHIR
ncbi:YlmC/YmxH family sporulation protein [Eubacteriales bacterium OttesenSCG-928-K08]|nr:YlmC/YmxH family sporulation protein [Eubacteriales bacterium OttesenSCG-928-K08]